MPQEMVVWCSDKTTSVVSEVIVISKIIGGEPADSDAYPFIASLRVPQGLINGNGEDLSGRHYCGGTLISKNVVLTAGHCVNSTLLRKPDVYFGLIGRDNMQGPFFESFKVVKTVIHPEFAQLAGGAFDKDAAILFLNGEPNVGPVSWKIDEDCFETQNCGAGTVLGWGLTEEGNLGSESDALLIAKVPFLSREECGELLGSATITNAMVCAGSKGKDACQNDSGGPLMVGTAVGGIVSWGEGCGREGKPGVYTSLPFINNWVQNQLGGTLTKVGNHTSCICLCNQLTNLVVHDKEIGELNDCNLYPQSQGSTEKKEPSPPRGNDSLSTGNARPLPVACTRLICSALQIVYLSEDDGCLRGVIWTSCSAGGTKGISAELPFPVLQFC